MKVDVTVNQIKFTISVGNGQQSFHWLATVIQERLKQFHLMRRTLEPETFIVTELRNLQNELINPKDKLYEHATAAGLSVNAIVTTAFPIDDWENPKFNDWMQVAYLHSATNQTWAKEMESWRENLQGIKTNHTNHEIFGISNSEAKRLTVNNTLLASKAIPHTARLIKIGFDFTEADVELAFNLDWQIMSWQWLGSSGVGGGQQHQPLTEIAKNKLGDVLKSNYSVICNIFAHYAGVAKVGQRYGLTIEELGHFFHFMRLFDWKNDEESVESIVRMTSILQKDDGEKKGGSSTRWLLITRAHFTEILTAVALQEKLGPTPDVAINEFLVGKVSDFWDLITSKYLQYTCPEPTLRKSFFEYYYLLRNIFHERSTVDTTFGARLALPDFLKLVKDATLVDTENENYCIACFLQSQLNPTVHYELEYLVFIEFIEAISRLALKAIENYSGLTDGKRIRMAFNMISELSSTGESKL